MRLLFTDREPQETVTFEEVMQTLVQCLEGGDAYTALRQTEEEGR